MKCEEKSLYLYMYMNLTSLISLHYNITNAIIEVLENIFRDGKG